MNIVIMAGSNRNASTSTRLAEYMKHVLLQRGYSVKLFDLYETSLPFYSPDESFSDHAGLADLQRSFIRADAVVLASPEYHGGMSGLLKNALDHLGQEHFGGKPVLCVSSAGGAVGVSSLQQMQAVVRNLHGINCPEWISIGGSQRMPFEHKNPHEKIDEPTQKRIHRVLDSFLELTQLIRGGLHREAVVPV